MVWLNRPARSSRRRAVAFLAAFLPAATASLIWVYSQPPEYRAVARLQISPAAGVAQATEGKDAPAVVTDAKSFLTEVQVLTSRPLLQDVIDRLKGNGDLPDLGPDPVAAAQAMLHAGPVAGTQVVELSATGPHQRLVSRLVNTTAEAYQQHVADAYKGAATSTYGEVADELKALEGKIEAKRDAVNAYRKQYDIVSMEHKENDVLADIEGLSQSYTLANERLEKAKGRLDALKTGKAVVRAKHEPTLADLQQRLSMLREQWHEMQRRFTPAYLALDADAQALQARLANLEEQLKAQTAASQRTAVAEAQEELASAQAAAERLRQDVAANQKQAQEFATHLNDYKAMREDLDHLGRDASCRARSIGEIAGERGGTRAERSAGGRGRRDPAALAPRLPAGGGPRSRRSCRVRAVRGLVCRLHRRAGHTTGAGFCAICLGAGAWART